MRSENQFVNPFVVNYPQQHQRPRQGAFCIAPPLAHKETKHEQLSHRWQTQLEAPGRQSAMKIKTSTLIGPQLDWAVATVSGIPPEEIKLPAWGQSLFRYLRDEKGNLNGRYMTGPDLLFSTKWEAGGPIIEREHISTKVGHSGVWIAYIEWNYADEERHMQGGPTPLIAALRCYVASHLGDEVEIPDELARQ